MSRITKRKKKKSKSLAKGLFILLISLLVILLLFLIFLIVNISKIDTKTSNFNENDRKNKVISSNSRSQDPIKINLSVMGDIMAHNPQLEAQYDVNTNTYDFNNNFKYVAPYINDADLAIANLETTLAGPSMPYTSYPTFNSPDTLVDAVKNAGIDIVSTINNHSFDKGDLGLERTLKICKEKGLETVGTVENISDKNYIIKDVSGINVGITAFSYGNVSNNSKAVNGIEVSNKSKDKMNVFDMVNVNSAFNTIKKQLDNIKNTDLQIVVLHWGSEYQRTPNKFQVTLAQMLCNYGVDIIIGSHPHVVQPMELINSYNNDTNTLVIYSLGNFISNQRKELMGSSYTEDGLIVNIEITKDTQKNRTFVSKAECIPTWVNKYQDLGKMFYEIIPIENKTQLKHIPNLPISSIKQSYNNTKSQIKQSNIINFPYISFY
ncbi:CapA family protein [Romboutsia lituseburensis]|uniref:CapA family protein n=1 Tax=Romboutsia lituseburensis TaxID=1537 RepID=UPI00215A4D2C|nr:CapA family protein [Romboutsia lituseburensis]MCR8745175.1 CapA family protein [Romboutsia lituseburensis]